MSVLKYRRSESKAEFVNTANQIYLETLNFLSRLSARYSRLIANKIMDTASAVLIEAEAGNSIFPSNDVHKKIRETHFLEARAALRALDVLMSHCYNIMMLNPAGCFTKSNGDTFTPDRARQKLESMAQNLGELIDKETNLLTNVIKSDKSR